MTPTHLSMSHEGKETLSQIVEGLEGVYDGPWELDEFQRDMRPNGLVMSAHGTIIAEIRGYLDSCGNRENGLHIARCHPDAIRAIAAYVEALEKERDELRAALEPFANAIFNDNGDITVDLSFAKADDFIKAYFVHRRTGAALKGDA